MIKIYGNSTGAICRVDLTDYPAELMVTVPDATSTLILDAATNAALAVDFVTSPQFYALQAGVLYKFGQVVTVAAPGPDTTDTTNQAITPAGIQTAIDLINTRLAGWAALTPANKQTAILNDYDTLLKVIRGMLRVVLWLTKK